MDICSTGHDEIVYDGRDCPACILQSTHKYEIEALETRVNDLQNEVQSLEDALDSQETRITKMIESGSILSDKE